MMSSFVTDTLKRIATGSKLDDITAEAMMNALMGGELTPIQTAGMLAAMTVRGETVEEIAGFARAMRAHAVHLEAPSGTIDTCGTGGDGADTFNISTATAFVAAAAGVAVAKHGNRAVSSKSGSADVLQALGARIDLDLSMNERCLAETDLCFMFAPSYHPAMKHAIEPRKQLGFRTVFNILGPLTNPAMTKRQVLGVFRPDLVRKVADVLLALGSEHAVVVHGDGGIDEISIQGPTLVAEVKDGAVREYTICPEDFGISSAPLAAIVGGDAAHNAGMIRDVFSGKTGPARDVVVFNSGVALYVGGRVATIAEGVSLAEELIDSGAVLAKLEEFVDITHVLSVSEVAQ